MPRDGLTGLTFGAPTNPITGYTYDGAGNQTRAKRSDGIWQRYKYDAAGRLVAIKDDTGATLASYKYGSSNQRLIAYDGEATSPDKTY
jgi:YD repeat-containing protein